MFTYPHTSPTISHQVELEGAKGQIEALGAEKTKLEDEQNKRKLKLKELKEKHKQVIKHDSDHSALSSCTDPHHR